MKKLFYILLAALFVALPTYAAQVLIQPGDTLSKIAQRNGTTVEALAQFNGIDNPDLIYAGQTLETGDLVGATIPTVIALYSDSLASRMSSTAETFTLVRGTDKQDRALSGFYGFVIDEGSTSEEFVTATCSSTACTVVTRGIDVQDGETSITALKFEHRRGATVKMTNYPQLAILSRILNGTESASSTFMFGNGETSQNKKLMADNADANLPFLQYNESANEWQYSDDGVSTVAINSGAAGGLTASTTKGIGITDSKIYIDLLTGGGLNFTNGGLHISSSTAITISDLTAGTTADQFQISTDADSSDDPTRYSQSQTMVSQNESTSTSGEAFAYWDSLYVKASDGKLYKTDADGDESTYSFIGFALDAATGADETVRFAKPGAVVTGASSLTAGSYYYISGTTGSISVTPHATRPAKVAQALSTTSFRVIEPKFIRLGSQSVTSSTTYAQTTGFYPTRIEVTAGTTQAQGGMSIGDDSNRCTYIEGLGTEVHGGVTAKAWYVYDANASQVENAGTVTSKTQTGFTLSASDYITTATVYWTAYSE
uniref:LysM domain-containing protein n=1 Tax=viral metagenome TaxID=1070528 RepID=A0A6H1ZBY3_9ZZZZ